MVCDSHIHIGRFKGNLDFCPEEVAKNLMDIGVDTWLYFSTSAGKEKSTNEYYQQFLKFIIRTEKIANNRAFPALLLTEQMLKSPEKFIDKKIFRALKWHEGLPENVVQPQVREKIFQIAHEYKLPIIIHTSDDYWCSAKIYYELSKKYKKVTPVFAHGRPFCEMKEVLQDCSNVYLDTAYLPLEKAISLKKMGFEKRMLWGSDYPIDKYFYPKENINKRYKLNLENYKKHFSKEFFSENFIELFKK